MKNEIAIVSMASISAMGMDEKEIWHRYLDKEHTFVNRSFGKFKALVSDIDQNDWQQIEALRSKEHYKDLDASVLLAIHASRKALLGLDWKNKEFGINIGSSRGATSLFEKYFEEFTKSSSGRVSTLSSPTTTLGNISSWVAHDLQSHGPTISHSIACSTALHAILNGVAWIRSGMSDRFLVGGSEASNTPFTLAQMKALKIYSGNEQSYPCRSLDFEKSRNTMIIGEGAAVFCLENNNEQESLALIEGIGYATEPLKHNISISTNADCFQVSMKMALKNTDPEEVDVIVCHAPGTIKGDLSEFNAIQQVFGKDRPALTSNKWKIGHTLGASGGFNIQLAINMLIHQQFIGIPFLKGQKQPKKIRKVMVNSVGFGGNAVSILLSK